MPVLPPNGLVSFGNFQPDIIDLNTNVSNNVTNVLPRADGYGPHPDINAFTQSLPAPCRGAFYARNADGSAQIFAGTAESRLYELNNTNFSWIDVSNGGVAYPALIATDNWQFVQFNTLVIAVQQNTVPQVFTLGSSTAFSALGGSPPQASHVAIVNRFIVLSGLLANYTRVQWSDLDNPTQWTAGIGLADFQDLPDGGLVHDVRGSDYDGVIFQDSAIRRMVFSPGSPIVFDIQKVSDNDGIYGQYSSIKAGDNVYFHSPQGFKVIVPGGYPSAIGKEAVDRSFSADLDQANMQLFVASTDPQANRVYWAYKSGAGSAGLFDKVLIYDWALKRWTTLKLMGQHITFAAKPGITLEGLDAIAPGIITISNALNNGSGAIRLTISGLTAGTPPENTNLNIQNTVEVYNVTGTTEANGNWRFTIIDGTHIDLIGSAFVHAYTGGGAIGGSLDQLAFSLDAVNVIALPALAAFNSSGKLGFFNGPNLEAILETPEQNGAGRRIYVSSMRMTTDCPTAQGSIGWRDNIQKAVAYTNESAINFVGECPNRIDGRYVRARLRNPYGATWSFATGVEILSKLTSVR